MKFWKHTLISAFAFLGVASTVLYTSCVEDSCTKLHCLHDATCSDGFCRCTAGWEGAECGQPASNRFIGKFYGFSKCNEEPPYLDTAKVWVVTQPARIAIIRTSAPNDTLMGNISGTRMIVDEQSTGGRIINVYAENNKITIYVQKTVDGKPTTCTMEGTRKPEEL